MSIPLEKVKKIVYLYEKRNLSLEKIAEKLNLPYEIVEYFCNIADQDKEDEYVKYNH